MSDKKTGDQPDGWAWFDGVNADVEALRAEQEKTALDMQVAYASAFSTPAGQVVLRDMQNFLDRVRAWDPTIDVLRGMAQGYYREGQNSMVAYIREMVKRGQTHV